jgi:CDP-diacylglycerol--glycerol-3-phosphate 3-phosphatidyltransferase
MLAPSSRDIYLRQVRWAVLFSLPNAVTLLRLPLAVLFLWADSTAQRVAILGMASASDFADGWLARRYARATKSGALLDPIADKVFVLAALAAFLRTGDLSTAEYFVILSRDFATAIGFLVAWRLPGLDPASFKARMPGKIVTVLQLIAILVLTLTPRAISWLVLAIGVMSAVAIIDYTLVLHRTRRR